MKKYYFFLVAFISILGAFFWEKAPKKGPDFVCLKVKFFPFVEKPVIETKIGDKKFSMFVDSGSSHSIDLPKHLMTSIDTIKQNDISTYIGIKGKKYFIQGYQLPKIYFDHLTISDLIGYEESDEFLKDAKINDSQSISSWLKETIQSRVIDGRIGWRLFSSGVVFFDFPKKNLMLAKDISAWQRVVDTQNNKFFKIPCKMTTYGVLLTIETDLGKLEFLLDSGASHSIIHPKIFSKKTPNQFYTCSKLQIENQDLGAWDFLLFDYTEKMEFDGILGVDFFKKHSICIDFPNQEAYIKM